ncbi:sensor histidine kinase [Amycolatopsis samaneae]|uniref:histidine kinase n=1 Tax=Amycolatopsis samaneae TaxID=664691 RepID=A0ABW5GXA5_9PSEU
MPRFLRSTRFRIALVAFASSAVALSAVAVGFVVQAQARLESGAAQLADARAAAIVQLLNTGTRPEDLPGLVRDSLYEVTDRSWHRLASCPGFYPHEGSLLPVSDLHPDVGYTRNLPVYGVDMVTSTGCSRVLGVTPEGLTGIPLHAILHFSGDGKYAVFGAARVDEDEQRAVDSARTGLLVGVPLVSLLIGLIAWLAVHRSLRPVEAIRAEVAEISAHDLGRRVPAPRSGDELARLAVTMNTMLERLDTAVARQGRFTADASHELRTPLSSLRTQLEVLLAHPDSFDWRTSCENALLDVTRLQDLVADLVLLGKLDNAAPPPFAPVALSEVVTTCLDGREIRDGVTITTEYEGTPIVRGHRARLVRLVRNLLDNAERHAAGHIAVTVSTVDAEGVLTVTDDGPGIPADEREHVFDRFVRLDEARDRDTGGSGLGLAIAAEIAHTHHGTIEVAPGEGGARLVVRLPALDRPPGTD